MKRKGKLKKAYKGCLKELDEMLGEDTAGLLIAIAIRLLKETLNGRAEAELRTLELKINDYFSAKWDFEQGGFANA